MKYLCACVLCKWYQYVFIFKGCQNDNANYSSFPQMCTGCCRKVCSWLVHYHALPLPPN